MKEHIVSILDILQTHPTRFFIIYTVLAALSLRYAAPGHEIPEFTNIFRLATTFSFIIIIVYLMTLASYVIYPNYLDHVEPTVASISWLGIHGRSFYPNWMTDDIYGLPYGPLLYLLNGSILLAYPTLAVSKLSGVLSLLVAFGFMFLVIRKKLGSNLTGVIFVASVIMILAPFGEYAYWNRAEPILISISALALFAGISLRPLAAVAAIGALAGIAAGFKLSGFLYVVPTAMMVLSRANTTHERVSLAIIGILSAITMALLPFCLQQSSLVDYLQYLKIAANQELSLSYIKNNLSFALVLIAPTITIWFWRRPAIDPPDLWAFAGLLISIAITVVIGGRGGAGPYHFLPFVPLCLYAAIVVANSPAVETRRIAAIVFVLLLLAYGPTSIQKSLRFLYFNWQAERDKIIELQTFLNSYPNAQIGVSDEEHYSDSFYRIIAVLQGQALHVDFTTWNELDYAGVPEETVRRFFNRCEVPTWILPLGAPFMKKDWYTDRPMLSDDFRRMFSTNYRMIQLGQTYQVWGCR